jgi:hypothetical protein
VRNDDEPLPCRVVQQKGIVAPLETEFTHSSKLQPRVATNDTGDDLFIEIVVG